MALNIDPMALLIEKINAANAVGLRIKAAKSDPQEQVSAIIETSDDERIVKFRNGRAKYQEQIAKLQEQLAAAEDAIREIAATMTTSVESDFDVEAATAEFLRLRKEAYDTRKALEVWVPAEVINAELTAQGVGEVVNLRGVKSPGGHRGAPTGIKRPRISAATMDGAPVAKDDGKVDFGTLAKASGIAGSDLKAAAFAAAKTEDLNSLAEGTVVRFAVGGKDFTVTVSGEKPGRKATEK